MADDLVVSEGQVTSPQSRLCTCFETEQKYRIILERLPFSAECHGNKSTSATIDGIKGLHFETAQK